MQGLTESMASSLGRVKQAFPLRIWIVDNSGSMQTDDGHLISSKSTPEKLIMKKCTRWEELRSCVQYHMRLAALIKAPTQFRLLNPYGHGLRAFSIAEGDNPNKFVANAEVAVQQLHELQPRGGTPLTAHVGEIRAVVESMAPMLRESGQRVSIIIATDGIPTDGSSKSPRDSFVRALRTLEGLPVWLVIRLCTDDDSVVDFYNEIDSMLELSIDVLDDFEAEAKEVYEVNPWINYTLPIHRLREAGYPDRLFDIMDERAFTKSEVNEFCRLIFGTSRMDGAPDASADWTNFLEHVSRLSNAEKKMWNPVKRRPKTLISEKKLNRKHGKGFFS